MEYYFNELDPKSFQRLINAILVARVGEDIRITPLSGQDGGRDSETATDNPYMQFEILKTNVKKARRPWLSPVRPGKYVFQSKFHRTTDARPVDVRSRVLSEFSAELRDNIIPAHSKDRITYFFLVTNVSGSRDALVKLDEVRRNVLQGIEGLHADIW
ncbi:MAG TPA: hypothetical protein VLQ45_30470 [Thermoanaerobaculia bacterium]|nr:hypothetical protein [Thermoanaerobaculia bacterium]